jgi:hypothetical protein
MKHIFILLALLFFLFTGCDETNEPDIDLDKSKSLVDSARHALENVLFSLLNNGAESPQEVDFREPYNLYSQAYAADPNNMDAVFGYALTNMMMINQEQEINQVFEEWNDLLSGNTGLVKSSKLNKPVFPTTRKHFEFPQKQLLKTIINFPKVALTDPPQFNDLQNLIDEYLLPKLDLALEAFDRIDDNPDFVFKVTPRMQGHTNADTLELDLTEVYAMQVMLGMLNSVANMIVAYNVDIWGYDSTEAIAAFSKGGNFLKLRKGAGPMNNVKNSLYNAMEKMISGMEFLLNESDNQLDDLIRKDGISQSDIDEAEETFENIKNTIDNPQQFTDDWDENPSTPEETITIDFGQIFDNPIEDLKAKLPDYTITVSGEALFPARYRYLNVQENTTVTVSSEGFYSYYRYYYWENGDVYDSGASTSLDESSNIDNLFEDLVDTYSANPAITNFYIEIYWLGSLNTGENTISVNFYIEYEEASDYGLVYLPSSFEWEAQTFNQWIFPDPTFNGIFPGMTDSEFKRIFGITENDW